MSLAVYITDDLCMTVVTEWKLVIDETRNRSNTSFHLVSRDRETKTRDHEFLFCNLCLIRTPDHEFPITDFKKTRNLGV
jgi:hypothetical protein